MTDGLSRDTLQGLMFHDASALFIVATIRDKGEYEIGLVQRQSGDVTTLEVTEHDAVMSYAIRRVSIWRPVGSDSFTAPFPMIGFSSPSSQFIVLDEKLTRHSGRNPIVVDTVRLATEAELDRWFGLSYRELEQLSQP